jgi:hypothetical protein
MKAACHSADQFCENHSPQRLWRKPFLDVYILEKEKKNQSSDELLCQKNSSSHRI